MPSRRYARAPTAIAVSILLAALTLVSLGCSSVTFRNEFSTVTEVHGRQTLGGFKPGTWRWVKTGLVASAAAPPSSEDGARLGQIAMDKLVKKAKLGPNQLLVNVTVERGEAFFGSATKAVVTIRADVIELGTPPSATAEPRWGDPLPGAEPMDGPAGKKTKSKKGGR